MLGNARDHKRDKMVNRLTLQPFTSEIKRGPFRCCWYTPILKPPNNDLDAHTTRLLGSYGTRRCVSPTLAFQSRAPQLTISLSDLSDSLTGRRSDRCDV